MTMRSTLVGALLIGIGFASAARAGRQSEKQRQQELAREEEEQRRANKALEKLPSTINMKVGEKKLYSGVNFAATGKGGIIRIKINDHDILEVYAVKAGKTVLIPEAGFNGAKGGPKGKWVMVNVSE